MSEYKATADNESQPAVGAPVEPPVRPLVERLRDTPNWMRERFGSWKDCVLKYDRAPFEAADELDRLHAARRWIPVAERLPEKFTEVLVAFAGQLTLASTGQWTGSPHDHNGWCYPAENNGICDDGSDPVVTHWMPMPEVPERPNVI